jgi:hypothetical protein
MVALSVLARSTTLVPIAATAPAPGAAEPKRTFSSWSWRSRRVLLRSRGIGEWASGGDDGAGMMPNAASRCRSILRKACATRAHKKKVPKRKFEQSSTMTTMTSPTLVGGGFVAARCELCKL